MDFFKYLKPGPADESEICALCLDNLECPRSLRCGHCFCQNCLLNLIRHRGVVLKVKTEVDANFIGALTSETQLDVFARALAETPLEAVKVVALSCPTCRTLVLDTRTHTPRIYALDQTGACSDEDWDHGLENFMAEAEHESIRRRTADEQSAQWRFWSNAEAFVAVGRTFLYLTVICRGCFRCGQLLRLGVIFLIA